MIPVPSLVEQLRFYACANYGATWKNDDGPAVLREAAAEIERLSAENADLREFIQNGALFDAWQAERVLADRLVEFARPGCRVCDDDEQGDAELERLLAEYKQKRSAS